MDRAQTWKGRLKRATAPRAALSRRLAAFTL